MAEDGDTAAKLVFSLLSNSFQDTQQASLEDYITTSVMLQYNSCFHRHGHNHYYNNRKKHLLVNEKERCRDG